METVIACPEGCRAGLYIRLSKEDESEGPSQSVQNQRLLLEDFAARHHIPIFDVYIDDGWSGTSFDRPAFNRLLEDIEAGRVNMVITKDLSRLGRDYILTGHYLERYFPEKRVRYISLLDGIDTGIESTNNEITPFRAIMNDMYARDISKKIRSVKHDKQRRGLYIGGRPLYGYKLSEAKKNTLEVDEEAAAVVRRVFAMALEGLSCRAIAQALNEAHIPPPSVYGGLSQGRAGPYAGLWSGERIAEMLKNPMYLGHMVQGRRRKISYKSKKSLRLSPEDWVVVEGTHPPLVDPDTFERVGQLIESRKATRSRTYDFLLKGLVFCHECGYPLGVVNRKTAAGEDCLYLICRTYQRNTRAGVCTSHCIREQALTNRVLESLRETLGTVLNMENLLPAAREAVLTAARGEETGNEAARLRTKLHALDCSLEHMYLDKLAGLLEETDFRRLYGRLREEREALETRLACLEERVLSPRDAEDTARALAEDFIQNAFHRREVLCALIARAELTTDKNLIIRYRFRPVEADIK